MENWKKIELRAIVKSIPYNELGKKSNDLHKKYALDYNLGTFRKYLKTFRGDEIWSQK